MDELIEIATRILAQHWRDMSTNMSLDRQRMLAGHVVPVIAAQALRDAADREMAAWESVPMSPDWMEAIESVCETLRARADQIEKEGL